MRAQLQKLYDWTMALAAKPYAMAGLFLVAFAESSVFPIPPDVLIIPMVLAAREKAWTIALVATVASVAGGMLGYAIGYYFYEGLGQPILEAYGYVEKFEDFAQRYNEYGAWIVAGAGLTPFPYKVITIASGVTHLDLGTFTLASTLSRGARFFLVAGLLYAFGPPIRSFIEKHLGKLTLLFFVLLIGGFIAIKYLF